MSSTSSLCSTACEEYETQERGPFLSEASGSISTLVNPAPPLTLVFGCDSVTSATLYSRNEPVYKITTNDSLTRTELYGFAEQRIVATSKRRDFLPDIVVFAHRKGKPLRVKKWLRKRKFLKGKSRLTDLETEMGCYTWRINEIDHKFALHEPNQSQSPVAYSRKSLDPPSLSLVLSSIPNEVQVEIIMSFLVLEHKLRVKERALDNPATSIYGLLGGGGQFLMM